jgi:hypothetical protein
VSLPKIAQNGQFHNSGILVSGWIFCLEGDRISRVIISALNHQCTKFERCNLGLGLVLMMQRIRAREDTPTSGSQTITSTENESSSRDEESVVLHLQVVPNQDDRRVTWDEQVIDNENMGKKSSKGTAPSVFDSSTPSYHCFVTMLVYSRYLK